ncbi:Mov34/MPN/PAD-1 family protein, partial [Pseudomonas aeruginosa]
MNTNVLTEHALSVIYRHACRTYPRECCGFVLADAKVKEGRGCTPES